MDDWTDLDMAEPSASGHGPQPGEDESNNPFTNTQAAPTPWPLSAVNDCKDADRRPVSAHETGQLNEDLMTLIFPNKEPAKLTAWLEALRSEEFDNLSDLAELTDADWTALGLPRAAVLHLRKAAAKWKEDQSKTGPCTSSIAGATPGDPQGGAARLPLAPASQVDAIVVDISKSMKAASSVDALQSREDVSKVLFSIIVDAVSALENNHAVGLVAFGEDVYASADITKDYEMFQTILGRLDANECGTRLWDAVAAARWALLEYSRAHCPEARLRVLALTDGQDNRSTLGAYDVALDCRSSGVVVDVVPLAGRHDELRSLAAATGGMCLGVASVEQAVALFAREPVIHVALREEGPLPDLVDRAAFLQLGGGVSTVQEVRAAVPAAMKEAVMDSASVKKLESQAGRTGPNGTAGSAVLKRIMSEYRGLESHAQAGCHAFINCNDFKFWKAVVSGPAGTPYEGRHYALSVRFPDEYPFKPPAVRFITSVYHPNINADGSICLDILGHAWSPALNAAKVLQAIRSLLAEPNPDDPLDAFKAALLQHEPQRYYSEARSHAEQHGLVLADREAVERYCSQ